MVWKECTEGGPATVSRFLLDTGDDLKGTQKAFYQIGCKTLTRVSTRAMYSSKVQHESFNEYK